MRFHRNQLLIYAVTDRAWAKGRSLSEQVEETLKGGATMVQFREKNLGQGNYDQMLAEALELRKLTERYQVPLIIDDDIELALACGADGLHVGQDDMDAGLARKLLGPDRILGVTAKTVEQAKGLCPGRGLSGQRGCFRHHHQSRCQAHDHGDPAVHM